MNAQLPPPGYVPPAPTKAWWKRKRVIIPAVIVVLIAIGAAAGGGEDDEAPETVAAATTAARASTTAEERATTTAARPTTTTVTTTITTAAPTTTVAPTTTLPPTTTTTLPPEPVVYEGQGDTILRDVVKPHALSVAHITYTGPSNFSVHNLDADLESISLLVNEIGDYEGTVPIDIRDGQETVGFEIGAAGPWRIELIPLPSIRRVGSAFDGTGDDVVVYEGSAGVAKIVHAGESNFSVHLLHDGRLDLAVNEIGSYDGEVRWPDPSLVVVGADGAWTVSVT